ncbi:MAG: hypothetical protein EA397_12510 [Deltaproteobacteria bacterium]|nr:MAG: hypothetical protein EA397_12510 [Deltaproteobacteria bacterium]
MADPHHIPTLDGHDRLTVTLYRSGLVLSALSILAIAVGYGLRAALLPPPAWLGPALLVASGVAVSVATANLHLYDKRIRWVLQGCAPAGLALQALGLAMPDLWLASWPLQVAGLGLGWVSLSGIALKEQFCFRIFGLRATPALLALAVLLILIDWPLAIPYLLGPAAVVLFWLALAKLRQPMHFDIGDKSSYQV